MESAVALSAALGIDFKLDPLDCDPFLHCYGEECSEGEVTIGVWKLPLTDMQGIKFVVPFYMTKGHGILLLGNNVIRSGDLLGQENLLVIPGEDGQEDIVFPTYHTTGNRTHLFVVPTQSSSFPTYFSSFRTKTFKAMHVSAKTFKKGMNGVIAKNFATKLHIYTHMHLEDMIALCKKANILTPILKQALAAAFAKCTSCKTTGKPLNSRQISMNKYLRGFNDEVQMDYMWVKELCEEPILHIKDSATGLSAATIAITRDQDVAAKLFTLHWVNIHGPPRSVSADNEFDNEDIRAVLGKNGTKFKARPSRRHNKTGGVESSNLTVRLFAQRLLQDGQYALSNCGIRYSHEEILSKAVYLKNIMYGQRRLSSFELARGFTPMIAGLPQMPVPDELVQAHHEQVVRRAFRKLAAT